MAAFFDRLLAGEVPSVFLLATLLLFLIAVLLFVWLQARSHKRLAQGLREASTLQEKATAQLAKEFSHKLVEYTNGPLFERVNGQYEKLVKQNLTPAVNEAAQRIQILSEQVVRRQEQGTTALANMLADKLSGRIHDFVKAEALMVKAVQDNVQNFGGQLSMVSGSLSDITGLQEQSALATREALQSLMAGNELLERNILRLEAMLEKSAGSGQRLQGLMEQNASTVEALAAATAAAHEEAKAAANTLASAHAEGSRQLTQAAEALSAHFTRATQEITSPLANVTRELSGISGSLNSASTQLGQVVNELYQSFGSNLSKLLEDVVATLSRSAAVEYQKILKSAEEYSGSFVQATNSLNVDVDKHVEDLRLITEQLSLNISTFRGGFENTSATFQDGLEQAMQKALTQLDGSLAEILKRLLQVAQNLQDAADALPRAINAMRKEG